jgi:hypothetical protein
MSWRQFSGNTIVLLLGLIGFVCGAKLSFKNFEQPLVPFDFIWALL